MQASTIKVTKLWLKKLFFIIFHRFSIHIFTFKGIQQCSEFRHLWVRRMVNKLSVRIYKKGLKWWNYFQLSKIFNGNLQLTYFVILSSICLMFYRLNYILLKNIKFNFFTILVLFSPLLYFFFIIINGVGIRKEILLFLFYLWYLISISSKGFNENSLWKFIFIFPILLFVHEGLFFYLPYILIPILLVKKRRI